MQDSEDYDSEDSDKELQVAFSSGLLKSGTYKEEQKEKSFINDAEGISNSILELSKENLPWIERMALTVKPYPPVKPIAEQLGGDPDDLSGEAVHNDFKREMKFYRLAQAAVIQGLEKLHKLGVPTKRPEDYFAEMAKSDEHMKRVREKLLAKQLGMEKSEKAKKLREMRKFGKKVQHEVQQKRQKEKREMMDAVKKYRKGKLDKLDFLENGDKKQAVKKSQNKQEFQPNKRRSYKNSKFGFGGQKKRSKWNTASSAAETSDFSVSKHATQAGKARKFKGKKSKNQRPGKMKRQKMKATQR